MLKRFCPLGVMVFCACASSQPPDSSLHAVLIQQTEHHGALHIEDVYKFVYQGALGIEHVLTDTAAAKNYLEVEWREMTTNSDEPLYEIISPDSQWVRLNLKPYKAAGGNVDAVWQAMLRSSQIETDKQLFVQRWKEFISLVDGQRLPFDRNQVHEFDRRMALAE